MMRTTKSRRQVRPADAVAGFTLIELLTVVFIIGLLIAILIPSLNGARNAAKSTSTSAVINNALKTGLEMFRTENEKDFAATNGYPPSFTHPNIGTFQFLGHTGECPFLPEKPQIYGAQWLPLMLTGIDRQGLVQRSTVTPYGNLVNNPPTWYGPNPLNSSPPRILPRAPFYIDPAKTRRATLVELEGNPHREMFPDWQNDADNTPGVADQAEELPVLVDAFNQPILYYVANKFGTTANMVEKAHNPFNAYTNTAPQQGGAPYYFHQDNIGFTGDDTRDGWDFGGGPRAVQVNSSTYKMHGIQLSGAILTTQNILSHENAYNFARFILDAGGGELGNAFGGDTVGPLRPQNADTYLLISAGVDGVYGTKDDVTNFQRRAK